MARVRLIYKGLGVRTRCLAKNDTQRKGESDKFTRSLKTTAAADLREKFRAVYQASQKNTKNVKIFLHVLLMTIL